MKRTLVPAPPTHTWSGDASGWPDSSLERGPVRITGTASEGASWHVTTDARGWTSVVLVGGADHERTHEVIQRSAGAGADPVATSIGIRDELDPRARETTELGVLRVSPNGQLVELLNATLPTVLHWDPVHGLSPYEADAAQLSRVGWHMGTHVFGLRPGAAVVAATGGVLPHEASWEELDGFVRAIALDLLGGTLAEVPPTELGRLLRTNWKERPGPAGLVVLGMPRRTGPES